MKQKNIFFLALAFKVSFLLLSMSIVIFPVVWRSDSTKATVKQVIAANKNLEQLSERGFTLLIGAAEGGDIESVKLLLKHGVAINRKAQNPIDSNKELEAGNTALHYACLWAHVEIVEALVKAGAYVAMLNNFGNSPLTILINGAATRLEDTKECMRILFGNKDATKRLLLNLPNQDGMTPLMSAILAKNQGIVRLLLQYGHKKNGKTLINFGLKNKFGENTVDVSTREAGGKGQWRGASDHVIARWVKDAHEQWERQQ